MYYFRTSILYFFLFSVLLQGIYAQFPSNDLVIHPYLCFEGRGNLFSVAPNGDLYIGTTSNNVYKLSNLVGTPSLSIKEIDETPGKAFDTGCIDINNGYLILANSFGSDLIIQNISLTTRTYYHDFKNDGISAFTWLYRMPSTNIYYLGVSQDYLPNSARIVRLEFYPSNPSHPDISIISINNNALDSTSYTPAIVSINNFLFISTDKGKIIRFDTTNSTETVFDSGVEDYVRFLQTDGTNIFASIEGDIDHRFWRISNATTSSSGSVVSEINISGQVDTYIGRMYVYLNKIYMHNDIVYDINSFSFSFGNGFPNGGSVNKAYSFIGGFHYGNYYLFGYNLSHEYENQSICTKELITKNLTTNSLPDFKSTVDPPLTNEGAILQTIEYSNNILYTGTYYDGFLNKTNIALGSSEIIAAPLGNQADAIENVSNDTNDFLLYGCISGTNIRAYTLTYRQGSLGPPKRLPSFNRTDSNHWARITSITSDNDSVYFGTGEHFAINRAVDAVIISDIKSNFQNTTYDFEHSTSAHIIDPTTWSGFYNALSQGGNKPIRFIALKKHINFLFGIVGTDDISSNELFYETSYFFKLNITNNSFEVKSIPVPLRRNFSRKTLKIVNNSYILVGAGTHLWRYDLTQSLSSSPAIYKEVGDQSLWQEDHIKAIEYKSGRIYVCFANKVKIYNEEFEQIGTFRTPDDLDTFVDMSINGNYLYVISNKGHLYKFYIYNYLDYSKAVFVVSGDFNQDGRIDDLAELSNYENTIYGTGLKIKVKSADSANEKFTDEGIWLTKYYFNPNNIIQAVVGDYDGDGFQDDIATLYDNKNGTMAIHVFKSNGSSFSYLPNKYGPSSSCNPAKIKFAISGDFDETQNNDIKDIAIVYDNGSSGTSLRVFNSNGSNFSYLGNKWGPASYFPSSLIRKALGGDFDQDNCNNDIAVFYDNNNQSTAIHVFNWNGSSFGYAPNRWGPASYFNANLVRHALSGDFDQDGKVNDIAVYYDYNGSTGIHMFNSYNTSSYFSYDPYWWDDYDNPNNPNPDYNSNNVRFAVVGDFKWGPGSYKNNDIVNYYDGGDQTAIHLFIANPSNNEFIYDPNWFNFVGLAKKSNSEVTYNSNLPKEYNLLQNFPNPFNPTTTISFELPEAAKVLIDVYTINGQKVRTIVNNTYDVGSHHILFNGKNLSSGLYFYKLSTPKFTSVKRMLLLK